MASLQEKINKILETALDGGKADLETLPNGHVCGHVVSTEFEGQSYEERRLRIRQIIEKELKPDELVSVSMLLTYTPQEYAYEPKES